MKLKKLLLIFFIFGFIMTTTLHAAEVPTGGEMMIDAILIRPIGLVSIALGSVLFVGSLIFTLPSGSVKQTFKRLVVYPAKFTFTRKLGSFSGSQEELLYEQD